LKSTAYAIWEICFEHEAFRSGKFDTHFVKNYYNADVLKKQMAKEAEIAALWQ
jgi:propionyl-CoA carboxylase alpha chain